MKRLTTVFLVSLVLGLMFGVSVSAEALLSVHFIDVGQGDAILIDYGQYELLIDGGKGTACSLYLREFVDGPLECIVATHMDADHIGGLDEVLEQYQVNEVWTNGNSHTTAAYYDFRNACIAEGCRMNEARRNDTIALGNLSMTVLHPSYLVSDRNCNSVVLLFSFMECDFLFTGDIDQSVESTLESCGLLPDIDVLKVAHHGSRSSTSEQFLSAVTPWISIISVGATNPYGHPTQDVLQRIGCAVPSSLILRTDIHGTIILSVGADGRGYRTTTRVAPIEAACNDRGSDNNIGNGVPCNCNGPDLNCGDFSTHAEAQACYDYCISLGYGDVFGLDGDNDGSACESLP